jgi:hypothetical protein
MPPTALALANWAESVRDPMRPDRQLVGLGSWPHGMTKLAIAGFVVVLAAGSGLSGCGGSGSKKPAASTAPLTTTAPATTVSTLNAAQLRSDTTVAVALDKTILTQPEVVRAGFVGAGPSAATAGNRTLPQGPLNVNGVAAVLPGVLAYRNALTSGGAQVGANHTYLSTSGPVVVDLLAVKFTTLDGAKAFVQTASAIVQAGGGKSTPHPEVHLGVLATAVVRALPAPGAVSQAETTVTGVLYDTGVYYLVTTQAAAGQVSDDQILGLLRAEDTKYQAGKATLR